MQQKPKYAFKWPKDTLGNSHWNIRGSLFATDMVS